MKNIVSFSGGKDSTAMILLMMERGIKIDEIINFSMGDWEWPQMIEHIEKFKEKIGINITTLKFENLWEKFSAYGFPNALSRWCTAQKQTQINKYLSAKYANCEYIQYIGIAFDETERLNKNKDYAEKYIFRYPLVEYKITEEMALKICYSYGFDWGGLYELLPSKRVSCWCCPLQTKNTFRVIWEKYPKLWQKLVEMQRISEKQPFRIPDETVFSLEHHFWSEKRYGWKKEKYQTNQIDLFK